jgi:Excreted virulence factor EspC, type VII ESX diderm
MDGDLNISGDVLRQHSVRVEQVAADIATAQAAANTTGLHNGAFGVICSLLPPFIAGTDSAAREAISSAKEALDAVVRELRSMATSFEATDEEVEAILTRTANGRGR